MNSQEEVEDYLEKFKTAITYRISNLDLVKKYMTRELSDNSELVRKLKQQYSDYYFHMLKLNDAAIGAYEILSKKYCLYGGNPSL